MELIPISEKEIADTLFTELVMEGLAPTRRQCELIAEIVFDFLVEKGAIELDGIEYEEEDEDNE